MVQINTDRIVENKAKWWILNEHSIAQNLDKITAILLRYETYTAGQ